MPKYTTEWDAKYSTHRDSVLVGDDDWMEGYLGINLSTTYSDGEQYETSNILMDPNAVRGLHAYLGQWLEDKS